MVAPAYAADSFIEKEIGFLTMFVDHESIAVKLFKKYKYYSLLIKISVFNHLSIIPSI